MVQSTYRAELLENRMLFSVVLVDDDNQQFSNAPFTSLASAIRAAKAGDTIRVAPGTYRQAIVIPAGKDGLTIIADRARQSIIDPPDGSMAAISVNARNVSIQQLTIVGLKTSYGVLLNAEGASMTVADCRIKSVRNDPLNGVQSGFGVGVFNGSAVITNNVIDDYQKGGIYADGGHSKVTITGNTLVGAGVTSVIAQNGIVVNRNASGTISGNRIRANHYTGSDVTGAGITLYRAREVTISNNVLSDNQENMRIDFSNGTKILNNEAFGGMYDGVALYRTTGALIRGNYFHDNELDGIYVEDSIGNTIEMNTLADNDEFDANDTTSGSRTAGTGNRWLGNTIGTKNNNGLM